MNAGLRFKAEQHAVALLLAFSGAMFGIGLLLQRGGKAIDDAVTWVAPR